MLKVADRQRNMQLLCQVSKALQHWVALKRPCQLKELLLLVLAEVGRLEKLLQGNAFMPLDHLAALLCRT